MVDKAQFTGALLTEAHKVTAVPAAAIMYVSMMLIFAIAAFMVGAAKKTFWGLWFIALVAGAIVLWGIASMPNAVQFIASFFIK